MRICTFTSTPLGHHSVCSNMPKYVWTYYIHTHTHTPTYTRIQVTRGPAPRSLDLAKVDIMDDDTVQLSEWDEADFREAG